MSLMLSSLSLVLVLSSCALVVLHAAAFCLLLEDLEQTDLDVNPPTL